MIHQRLKVWKRGAGGAERRPLGPFLETGSACCQEGGDNRVLSVQSQGEAAKAQLVCEIVGEILCWEPLVVDAWRLAGGRHALHLGENPVTCLQPGVPGWTRQV